MSTATGVHEHETVEFERTTDTRWEPALSGLQAQALDCLQSTVAVIADEAYGLGTHLTLGCRWRFPTYEPDGTVQVQVSLDDRMAEATELLGLKVGRPAGPVGVPELKELAGAGPVYIVAEAYDLRWLPYARATTRYRQMPHSFLLEKSGDGRFTVIDAYYADTEWGRARPGAWSFSSAELDRAIQGPVLPLRVTATGDRPPLDPAAVLAEGAEIARTSTGAIDAYVAGVRAALGRPEGMERLLLDIWHLCRERLLHMLWLEHDPAVAASGEMREWRERAERSFQEWQRLAAQSYLAMRRWQRGAPPNTALVDDIARLMHSDAALMAGLRGSL